MRVLLVDDEPDIVASLKTALERRGYEVDGYTKPEKLLAEYKPRTYAMAFLDIRMPVLNGFDLYRELKKRDDALKICFLTAFDVYYSEFQKMFPDVEVKCFLRKPVRTSDVVEVIEKTVKDGRQ